MIFKTEFDTVLLWEECEGKANLMPDAGCVPASGGFELRGANLHRQAGNPIKLTTL